MVPYRTGDYVLLPRATTHRWVPTEESRLYAIEANSHIAPPKRYLSRYGQLLEHAPYCERDLHGPSEPLVQEGTDVEVLVKHRGNGPSGLVGTRLTYATHPLDVVGWDGCLYPYTFNVEDFMPITGKVHQPPPVHQVFEGHNFVVCNFCPRKVDYHEQSIPVPYYHSNVDSDEVMFYVGGDYEARKGSGINIGSISLHPGGHAHGPQPSAIEASIGVEYFDELAVMVDTFRPLELGEAGRAVEDPAYAWTWALETPRPSAPQEPPAAAPGPTTRTETTRRCSATAEHRRVALRSAVRKPSRVTGHRRVRRSAPCATPWPGPGATSLRAPRRRRSRCLLHRRRTPGRPATTPPQPPRRCRT